MTKAKKVILYGLDLKLVDFYSLNLVIYANLQCFKAHSFEELKSIIEDNGTVELVIFKSPKQKNEIMKLIDLKEELKLKVLLLGEFPMEIKDIPQVEKEYDLKAIIKSVAKICGISAKEMASLEVPDFFPIETKFFEGIGSTNCNVFIKEDNDYRKILEKDKCFNFEDVHTFDFLYIEKFERLKFINYVGSKFLMKYIEEGNVERPFPATLTDNLQKSVSKSLAEELDGISEEVVALANNAIESMKETVESGSGLKQLLAKLLEDETSYSFRHCQLIILLAFHALEKIEWGTKEQMDKLAFVAFFHDISLDREEYTKIDSQKEFEIAKLANEDFKIVNEHALRSSNIIKTYPRAPIGADNIILQHHGSRSGVGFPPHFGPDLSPLTIVFIVCENLAKAILDKNKVNIDFEAILKRLRRKFAGRSYRKILETFSDLKL